MKCIYINLEKATERKSLIENSFALHAAPHWQLERFPAIDTLYVARNEIKGSLRPNEKACFISHHVAIKRNIDATTPLMMLEDDAMLGPSTAAVVENFLEVGDKADWDIIFTDVAVPQPGKMAELIRLRYQLVEENRVLLLNLAEFVFAGSTAYIVNPKSIRKILQLMDEETELNVPYDLFLRNLIYQKKLTGLVFFPFVTSLSDESESSQIHQDTSCDLIWNAFRKLVWLDRDVEAVAPVLERIDQNLCDEESRRFGIILSALVAKAFTPK